MYSVLMMSVVLLCSCLRALAFAGDASMTIVVRDDLGQAVPDATVVAGWMIVGSGGKRDLSSVRSDASGVAQLRIGGLPDILVSKDGYYDNGLSFMIDTPPLFTHPVFAMNHPSVEVVLQRRVRPVPMFVRKIEARIPKYGEAIGYDLAAGDWVYPHGKGEFSDMIITMSFAYRGVRNYDYRCRLSFGNGGDGILLHPARFRFRLQKLRMPREAPETGFDSELEWNVLVGDGPPVFADTSKPQGYGPKRELENDNYIFRVRTKRDVTSGNESAMYGKIHGRISPGIRPYYAKNPEDCYGVISFLYYLNPDGTRSLEWDTVNNLAGPQDVPKEP